MKFLLIRKRFVLSSTEKKRKKSLVFDTHWWELDSISISDAIFGQGILISLCLRFSVTVIFVRLSAFGFLSSLGSIVQ